MLNRAVGRTTLFAKATNYEAFVRVLAEALDWVDIRLLAYCVMPNHWHLVVWPERDGDLYEFMRWLTLTHTQRWHAKHHTQGTGPLYHGRFTAFPVAEDEHCLRVLRYRRVLHYDASYRTFGIGALAMVVVTCYPHIEADDKGTPRIGKSRYEVLHLAAEHYHHG